MMQDRFTVNLLAISDTPDAVTTWSRLWLDHAGCTTLSEPDLVVYTSSAEAGITGLPDIQQEIRVLRRRHPDARHVFVSMACLGLHAAILEAHRSHAQSVLVFLVETPGPYLQAMLDVAGLGAGGEGLEAREGVAVLHLSRTRIATPDSRKVALSTILAKPGGPGGTLLLLQKLESVLTPLATIQDGADIVSFRMHSHWSDSLMHGFNTLIRPRWSAETCLLDSCEHDRQHYLSIKPARELAFHGTRQTRRPLVIITLGGGGRIGVLAFMHEPPPLKHSEGPPRCFMAARTGQCRNLPQPLYNSTAFRVDNGYFLDEPGTAAFDPYPWQPPGHAASVTADRYSGP